MPVVIQLKTLLISFCLVQLISLCLTLFGNFFFVRSMVQTVRTKEMTSLWYSLWPCTNCKKRGTGNNNSSFLSCIICMHPKTVLGRVYNLKALQQYQYTYFCQLTRIPKILGIIRVSCPHLIFGWASSIVLINVVPLRGIPPININGISTS